MAVLSFFAKRQPWVASALQVHMAAISSVVTQRWVELRDVTKTAREEDYAVI